jgi:NADH-quinone oxidoreductase subunit E
MLHLVQSVQGHVTPDGIAFCADQLGLTKAQVAAVVDVLHDVQAHARPVSTWSASARTRCAACSAATTSSPR